VHVTLHIGDADYPLDEPEARWLETLIRTVSVDSAGRAWDREASAALHIADLIDEILDRRATARPIEVGRTAALGLVANAFHDRDAADVYAHVAGSYGIAALYLALRRLALEGVERRRH
jgi:hypothetical protein